MLLQKNVGKKVNPLKTIFYDNPSVTYNVN